MQALPRGRRSAGHTIRLAAAGATAAAVLIIAAPATATNPFGGLTNFQGLPDVSPPAQVNNDTAGGDGIDPTRGAGALDLVAGATTAGKVPVPWLAFSQSESNGSRQIFVRAFKGGAWQTEGAPPSPGTFASLNFDQSQTADDPGIDFTGAGRAVPWVTWDESSTAFPGHDQIFASRFILNPPQTNGGAWQIEGQLRPAQNVPSLNIHTNQTAENPAIAGGATTAGANPAPWITWQEEDANGSGTSDQIFVSKGAPSNPNGALGQACTGDKPAATNSASLFCFQQTGIERVNVSADPSLNVDPTRDGIEPDIAFTGPGDTVPWVVWYETGNSQHGLSNKELVFAAKGIAPPASPPPGTVDGGIVWEIVGATTSAAVPLSSDLQGATTCGASTVVEGGCSLNHNPTQDAEDPQIAAGTMTPGANTVPWVTWVEDLASGKSAIFVARLDASGTNFDILNNGNPVSNPNNDSTLPDIVFDGNTPYVTWEETETSGTPVGKQFIGHFENAANPAFVLDTPVQGSNAGGISVSAAGLAGFRTPIASSCAPNSTDANACPAGAIGTPFFAFDDGALPSLFAGAFVPSSVTTGGATAVTTNSASVAAALSPGGAQTDVQVQFGADTNYSLGTGGLELVPPLGQALESPVAIAQALSGLPASTAIHYRAQALTDFTTVNGADASFTTATPPPTPVVNNPGGTTQQAPPPPPPPPAATVSLATGKVPVKVGGMAGVSVHCTGTNAQVCTGTLQLTLQSKKVVRHNHKKRTVTVTLTIGSATFTVTGGVTQTVTLQLTTAGRAALKAAKGKLASTARLTLTGSSTSVNGKVTLQQQKKMKKPKKKHHA